MEITIGYWKTEWKLLFYNRDNNGKESGSYHSIIGIMSRIPEHLPFRTLDSNSSFQLRHARLGSCKYVSHGGSSAWIVVTGSTRAFQS